VFIDAYGVTYLGNFEGKNILYVARKLADTILDHFADAAGGFFDTSDDAEALVARPKDAQDNAVPSGNAMAATVLKPGAFTGEGCYDGVGQRFAAGYQDPVEVKEDAVEWFGHGRYPSICESRGCKNNLPRITRINTKNPSWNSWTNSTPDHIRMGESEKWRGRRSLLNVIYCQTTNEPPTNLPSKPQRSLPICLQLLKTPSRRR
jgi:hypothetical protein